MTGAVYGMSTYHCTDAQRLRLMFAAFQNDGWLTANVFVFALIKRYWKKLR